VSVTHEKRENASIRPSNDPGVVRLTDRDIDDARRLLALLAGELREPLLVDEASKDRQRSLSRQTLIQRARQTYTDRRTRAKHFGEAMFGEAAWDMLLVLYMTDIGARQTVSSLARLSGSSKSTALRWMEYLEERQLIKREPHPTDKRSAFVALTEKGREKLEAYLSETVGSGN
jgi:DNA-binding MarR family transcriptional regulator